MRTCNQQHLLKRRREPIDLRGTAGPNQETTLIDLHLTKEDMRSTWTSSKSRKNSSMKFQERRQMIRCWTSWMKESRTIIRRKQLRRVHQGSLPPPDSSSWRTTRLRKLQSRRQWERTIDPSSIGCNRPRRILSITPIMNKEDHTCLTHNRALRLKTSHQRRPNQESLLDVFLLTWRLTVESKQQTLSSMPLSIV